MKTANIYGAELLSGNTFFGSGEDYWKQKRMEMESHSFVGRFAKVFVDEYKRVLKCIRADDDIIVFELPLHGELIVSRKRDEDKLWWLNEVK